MEKFKEVDTLTKGQGAKKYGRFPKLEKEVQELILEAEEAKQEDKEELLEQVKKKLKKVPAICGAMQGTGKICLKYPVEGSNRCHVHGGKSTGAKTEEGREKSLSKLNPKAHTIHGIYSKDFKNQLTAEEVEFYNTTVDWFFEETKGDIDPVNLAMLDRYIMNFIKQARKDSIEFLDDSPSYNDFETKMKGFAESLGLNRKFKLSKENKDNNSGVDLSLLFDMGNEEQE